MPSTSSHDPAPDSAHDRSGTRARDLLLDNAIRGFVPLRNTFVQRPRGAAERGSTLATLVSGKHERALDALLLLHALWPVINGNPLSMSSWARILTFYGHPAEPAAVSKVFGALANLGLVERHRQGRGSVITPLLEDGSGSAWSRPTDAFFALPHEYWKQGYVDRLRLPGKAMLLILLKETQFEPSFEMAVERAANWYGISERTAERGYQQLNTASLLQVKIQTATSPMLPTGISRRRFHRALRDPFSMAKRQQMQEISARETRAHLARLEREAYLSRIQNVRGS